MRLIFCASVLFLQAGFLEATPPPYLRHVRFTSQYNQDRWVMENIFDYKKNGFFLDIGAWNGELISNTYALEKYFSWKGICVEANPIQFQALQMNRESINVHACLDYTNHEVDFRYDNDLFGGIVDADTDNNSFLKKDQIDKSWQQGGIIKMQTKTLEQVLDENQAPKVIDFLSIDVEGSEYRIFKNFPFDKYTFLCMVIERPSEELHALLEKNGYVFVRNYEVDAYYIHPLLDSFERIQKGSFEKIPLQ